MLTIREAWGQREDYTKRASDNARKLAYALAALAWAFINSDDPTPVLVAFSLTGVFLFFICDSAQYFWPSETYYYWIRRTEKRIEKEESRSASPDDNIAKNPKLDTVPRVLFLVKAFALFAAAVFMAFQAFAQ